MFFTLLMLVVVCISSGECFCEEPDDWQNANTCYDIFSGLVQALIQDEGNIYRMKKAFFYAPSADPVLIKVMYNISYGQNISEEVLQFCANVDNKTAITFNQTEVVRGWTSRGVYIVLSPLLLSKMQMALPFSILRLFHNNKNLSSPEVDTFLWDGSYELPTLLLNLYITSIPCIPSQDVFNSTIDELTTFLKTYATLRDSSGIHTEGLGFHLSEEHLLYPNKDENDYSIYITFYCMFGAYLVGLVVMNVLLSRKVVITIATNAVVHHEIILPALLIGLFLEFCEFITITIFIDSDFFYFRMFIWFPTVVLFIYLVIYAIKAYRLKRRGETFDKFIPIAINCTIYISLLFLTHLFCYALPTFLLLLIYPTKVIAVVAYMITFIFSSSAICSVAIRLVKKLKENIHKIGRFLCCVMSLNFVLFSISPILMFIIMIQFLYALVLGEASAITAGPYTVLSLIPSALISAISWMLKNKLFGGQEEDPQTNATEDQSVENEENTTENHDEPHSNVATRSDENLTLVIQNNDDPKPNNRSGYGTVPTEK